MRILVHEFVTGGGWYAIDPAALPPESLRREAGFMVREVCNSLLSVSGVELSILRDVRLGAFEVAQRDNVQFHLVSSKIDWENSFTEHAIGANATVLIAPELEGWLYSLCFDLETLKAKHLGPCADILATLSYKDLTAYNLRVANVNYPNGFRLKPGDALPILQDVGASIYPAVIKPIDGCGSIGVRLVHGPNDRAMDDAWRKECRKSALLLEEFISGQPASVGAIAGKSETVYLPAFFQSIDQQHRFVYRGGALIEDAALTKRAHSLAAQALAAVKQPFGYLGYIGFDIIFGDAADGSQDYVIEVNPRFTTSFAALMGHVAGPEYSLMGALIDLVEGRPANIKWKDEALRFSVDDFAD